MTGRGVMTAAAAPRLDARVHDAATRCGLALGQGMRTARGARLCAGLAHRLAVAAPCAARAVAVVAVVCGITVGHGAAVPVGAALWAVPPPPPPGTLVRAAARRQYPARA